ncbi:MAG: hypothetical protein EOP50_02885 [Sphingobacteriales bacterium]|nr:MAG: hypothetical protein EOP50_02885 [Sphingobacteriales bacterium]
MFFLQPSFYTLSIVFQAFCVWHCVRRRNTQQWIWLIVFLPVVGCLVYLFSEVLSRRTLSASGASLENLIPGSAIGRLERQLEFSDTFANRMNLADAYARNGQQDKAQELYESCLSGPFQDHEAVYMKLIPLYYAQGAYEAVLPLAAKLRALPEFRRSRPHLLYALSLEYCGAPAEAEVEFLQQQGRFSAFEARYEYGCFLLRQDRAGEADELFRALVAEGRQLAGHERRTAREWIRKAQEQLGATA